jgi:hypothetical protein
MTAHGVCLLLVGAALSQAQDPPAVVASLRRKDAAPPDGAKFPTSLRAGATAGRQFPRYWFLSATGTYEEAALPRTPERFLAIAEQLKAGGKYEPKNGSTYCNWFARDFVKELLGQTLPELTGQANEQLTKMTASSDWEKGILVYDSSAPGKNGLAGMTAKELQELQDGGKLILYCWKHPEWSLDLPREQRQKLHGHIAIGMPRKAGDPLAMDETWGTKEKPAPVPMTAQSGSRVFAYGKLSQGFGTRRKDDILVFIYKK